MKHKNSLQKILAAALAAVLFAMPLTGCLVKVNDRNERLETPAEVRTEAPTEAPMKEAENWAEHMNVIALKNDVQKMKASSFDEKLMSYLSENTGGNFMASPLSFRYALGLLLSGAEGETKAELLKALGVRDEQEWTDTCLRFNAFVEQYAEGFAHELSEYKKYVKQGYVPADSAEPYRALRVANSVWRNENLEKKFTEAYTEKVSKNYAAEYRTFLPENVVQKVNEWAGIKTEKMIERLLPDNYDARSLAVVLMNALYFKDSWRNEFYEGGTQTGDFKTKTGAVTQKEFMQQVDHFLYYKDDATELLVMPMKGGVNMVFVLGETDALAEKINKAESRKVRVKIPKIDLETSFERGEFVAFLKANGVSQAFDDRADFSGMIDHPIFVGDIIQKTRIKLDEKGVEAAAVTAILMSESAMPQPEEPIEFNADRPFSFSIYANLDGEMATMFAGQIVE